MILKLILKDIRGYWRFVVLTIFLPGIAWSLLLFLPYYHWSGYVLFCSFAIFAGISYFSFSEKKQHLEILTCSLPVTRTAIMRAKYLAALFIAVGGMALWFLYACFLNSVFTNLPGNFHLFTNPIVIFFILFYFSLFISAFVPIVTIFDKIWLLTNLSILFAAIFIVPFNFYFEFSGLVQAEFEAENILFFSFLTVIIILLPWLCIIFSTRLFKCREL